MLDKGNFIESINSGASAGLELGCGSVRAHPGLVTIDGRDMPSVDICGDVFEALARIEDNKVPRIVASHFIEHVDDLPRLLAEIVRVSRPEATIELVAPHFSNAFFYSDFTHRTFFGLYTFCYLAKSRAGFRRQVPDYAEIPGLVLKDARLGFKSFRPFYVRHALRRLVGLVVNSSTYMKELYEEAGTGFVSCYEVEYRLTVEKEG